MKISSVLLLAAAAFLFYEAYECDEHLTEKNFRVPVAPFVAGGFLLASAFIQKKKEEKATKL